MQSSSTVAALWGRISSLHFRERNWRSGHFGGLTCILLPLPTVGSCISLPKDFLLLLAWQAENARSLTNPSQAAFNHRLMAVYAEIPYLCWPWGITFRHGFYAVSEKPSVRLSFPSKIKLSYDKWRSSHPLLKMRSTTPTVIVSIASYIDYSSILSQSTWIICYFKNNNKIKL